MKVALCLSGQPRVVEVGYHKLRASLLDHNDVDVVSYTHLTLPTILLV